MGEQYAGLDLGAKNHYFAVWDTTGGKQGRGAVVRQGEIPNTEKGFARLLDRLVDKTTGALPSVAAESERGLFPVSLQANGCDVFFVSPLQTRGLRMAFGMGVDKSDKRDAEALARGLAVNADRIRQMRGVTPELRSLHSLVRAHGTAQERAEQAAGVLRSHLADYWPAAIERWNATELRTMPWVRELIRQFPNHYALGQATDEQLRNVLIAGGRERRLDWTIERSIRPLATETVLHYPETYQAELGAITGLLADQLDASCHLVDRMEKQVADAYFSHPLSTFYDSIPGVGLLTGARLLAEIGDDPWRFDRPTQLAAYGGCRPQTDRSGGRTTVVHRRSRNKFLEQAICSLAGQIVIGRRNDTPPISPGAAYLYRNAIGTNSDGEVKKGDRRRTIYHGQRVVAQRLLGGIWHCTTYGARHPERGISYARWQDSIVFARQYTQMHAAGMDFTPANTLEPASRKHRRHLATTDSSTAVVEADDNLRSDLVEA